MKMLVNPCHIVKPMSLCIDFSINGLNMENSLRSQRTPTPYKK